MCELCDEYGEMQACEECGRLICFDVDKGDDIIRPAYTTAAGDLFCDICGKAADLAEKRAIEAENLDYFGVHGQ